MTLLEAIAQGDALAPNVVEPKLKAQWLSNYNREISNIMEAGDTFNSYPEDMELACPEPYDNIYVYYLAAMIYMHNQEWDNYNNITAILENRMNEFKAWWAQNNPSSAGGWVF